MPRYLKTPGSRGMSAAGWTAPCMSSPNRSAWTKQKHSIEIVVDRLVIREGIARRLTDSVESASNLSGGTVVINIVEDDRDILFSQNYACEDCGVSIEELTPRMFSFNNPYGACPTCTGLGSQLKVDPELIIPNKSLSILEGRSLHLAGITSSQTAFLECILMRWPRSTGFKLTDPVEKLSDQVMDVILYGTKGRNSPFNTTQPRGREVCTSPLRGLLTIWSGDTMRPSLMP